MTGAQTIHWYVKVAAAPSSMVGLLWNVGNVGSIIATLSPLGQTIGYPSTQTSLLIAGLIGIFVFKEITVKRKIAGFLASSVGLIAGAALLAVYGACT
jgi:glucose uptake protein GlcU